MIREAIQKAVSGEDLTRVEAVAVMREIMAGECSGAQIGSLLTAMRLKTESVDEIAGFAEVMRENATPIRTGSVDVIDTCGTGGDAQGTFNISTAAAIVAAAGGARVAKHGNRSVSSTSGSADVLGELGVNIEAEVACVEECVKEAGIGFLFAPMLHSAMKHVVGPRREMGIRTVFNILGPLTNPAGARHQLLGVYSSYLCPTMAMVLRELGSERAMVVHGHDGMDELTIAEETTVAELKDGEVNEYVVAPEDFGLRSYPLDTIKVSGPKESAAMICSVLEGKAGPARDIVLMNAGAALVVANKAEDFVAGLDLAAAAIDEGKAAATLRRLVEISQGK